MIYFNLWNEFWKKWQKLFDFQERRNQKLTFCPKLFKILIFRAETSCNRFFRRKYIRYDIFNAYFRYRIKRKQSFSNFASPFFNTCFRPLFFVNAKSIYPYNFLIRARRKNPSTPSESSSQNTPTMIYFNPWNEFLKKWQKLFDFRERRNFAHNFVKS